MWPPSSCQDGSKFSAVAKSPTQAARPTGDSSKRGGIRAGMKQLDENAHQRRIAKNDSGVRLAPGTIFEVAMA